MQSTYHNGVDHANANGSEHGDDQIDGDWHVNGNAVSLFQSLAFQIVGKLAHFREQLCISNGIVLIAQVALPESTGKRLLCSKQTM